MARNPVRRNCAQPHSCPKDARMKALARSPLTRALTYEEHLELDRHLSAWAWHESEALFIAGDKVPGSFLIVAGRVRITRDTLDGEEITVDIAAPGDVIGSLHIDPTEAVDSAWAMETTCALFLPAEALAQVIAEHPSLALAVIQMQHDHLSQSRESSIEKATKTVDQRVAAVLRRLNKKLAKNAATDLGFCRSGYAGLISREWLEPPSSPPPALWQR